jgi:hypothetical protein
MIQVIVRDPTVWGDVVAWLSLNRHPSHSIMIHPVTESASYAESKHMTRDHVDLAMWLGPVVPVDPQFGRCLDYVPPGAPYQPVADAMLVAAKEEAARIRGMAARTTPGEAYWTVEQLPTSQLTPGKGASR